MGRRPLSEGDSHQVGLGAMTNDDWDGAASMHKALKALATSTRPISASRVKTAAAKALENVKVKPTLFLFFVFFHNMI